MATDTQPDLPAEFTVRGETWYATYETDVYRVDGEWWGEAVVKPPWPLPNYRCPPEEMPADHAHQLYTTYNVVDERRAAGGPR